MGCGTDVPAERAHALRASGRIDDGEYAAIVSADARFRREEVAWRAQLEAHYSPKKRAASPRPSARPASPTFCFPGGGGPADRPPPPRAPLVVPVAVRARCYVGPSGALHGAHAGGAREDVVAVPVAALGGSDAAVRAGSRARPRGGGGGRAERRAALWRRELERRPPADLARSPLARHHDRPGRGVPAGVRPRVWRELFLRDGLRITDEYYDILSARAESCERRAARRLGSDDFGSEPPSSSGGDDGDGDGDGDGERPRPRRSVIFHGREKSMRLLELDAPRTLARFSASAARVASPEGLGDDLVRVLRAYAVYRPDVGYVQGMSYLAATLLLELRSPAAAFRAFANMLQRPFFFDFYRLDARDVASHVAVFDAVFEARLPRLFRHFATLGLGSDAFLVEWALTLFARCLPPPLLHHVWECFFLRGAPFFVECALALLEIHEKSLKEDDLGAVLGALRQFPDALDDATLFAAIARVRVSQAHYDGLRDRWRDDHDAAKPPPPPPPAPPPCGFLPSGCAPS